MRTMLAVLLMLAAPPSGRADSLDDYLNSPPGYESKRLLTIDDLLQLGETPSSPAPKDWDVRPAFNKIIRKMYRPDCGCLTYIEYGIMRTIKLPLSAAGLKEFLRGMRDQRIIPFGPKGPES